MNLTEYPIRQHYTYFPANEPLTVAYLIFPFNGDLSPQEAYRRMCILRMEETRHRLWECQEDPYPLRWSISEDVTHLILTHSLNPVRLASLTNEQRMEVENLLGCCIRTLDALYGMRIVRETVTVDVTRLVEA